MAKLYTVTKDLNKPLKFSETVSYHNSFQDYTHLIGESGTID